MKKVLMAILAAIIAFSPASAQTKQDIKAARKEAKLVARQLRGQGFKLLELGDMEMQLQNYLVKAKAGAKQIIGTAEGCKSINLGKTTALNNALNEYASLCGGMVKGRVTSEVSNISDAQIDNIIAAYERLVHKEIKGEVQTCVTLIKESGRKYDVRLYCLVDYDAAHAARMRAMERALEEQEVAQQYGSKISDWIDEGFEEE